MFPLLHRYSSSCHFWCPIMSHPCSSRDSEADSTLPICLPAWNSWFKWQDQTKTCGPKWSIFPPIPPREILKSCPSLAPPSLRWTIRALPDAILPADAGPFAYHPFRHWAPRGWWTRSIGNTELPAVPKLKSDGDFVCHNSLYRCHGFKYVYMLIYFIRNCWSQFIG